MVTDLLIQWKLQGSLIHAPSDNSHARIIRGQKKNIRSWHYLLITWIKKHVFWLHKYHFYYVDKETYLSATPLSFSVYGQRNFFSDLTIIVLLRDKERLILATYLSYLSLDSMSQNIKNRINLYALTKGESNKRAGVKYVT